MDCIYGADVGISSEQFEVSPRILLADRQSGFAAKTHFPVNKGKRRGDTETTFGTRTHVSTHERKANDPEIDIDRSVLSATRN